MERYEWRGRAKVVAIVDIVLSSMALFVVIVCALLAGAATAVTAGGLNNLPTDPNTGKQMVIPDEAKAIIGAGIVVLWILVGLMALWTIVELWAAIKLLNATEIGREPVDAHRLCTIFRNVCIVITVLEVLGSGYGGYYYATVIGLLIRVTFLYVVYNFMEELKIAQHGPGSIGVTAKV